MPLLLALALTPSMAAIISGSTMAQKSGFRFGAATGAMAATLAFRLDLGDPRGSSGWGIGGRSAFVELPAES